MPSSPAADKFYAPPILRWNSPVLNWAQRGIVVVVAVLFLQGRGAHGTFLAILFALPALRAILSPSYRQSWREGARRSWNRLEAFSREPHLALPWRAAFAWTAAPLMVLALGNGMLLSSDDNRPTMLTAVSLVRDRTPQISRFVSVEDTGPRPYFIRIVGGKIYSAYPAGMLLIAVPVVALSRLVGGHYDGKREMDRLEKFSAVLVAGACVTLFFLICLSLAPLAPAWGVALLFGFGSAVLSTIAGGLWTQGGVTLAVLVLLLAECRGSLAVPFSGRLTLLQALAISFALACRLTSAVLIAPFGLWLLWKDPRRAIRLALLALACWAPWAAYSYALYGNTLGAQAAQRTGFSSELGILTGLASVLFSPSRGLFVYQPWLLLAPVGLVFWRRVVPVSLRGLALVAVIGFALQSVLLAFWGEWHGGWCWGSRLMTETIPVLGILALPAVVMLWPKRAGRWALSFLWLLSFSMHLPHLYLFANLWMGAKPVEMSWQERHWQWEDPPFLYPLLHGMGSK